MEHATQHWIPQSYLEAWCDPDTPQGHTPFVWRFSRDGSAVNKKAPKNIFYENNMYTLHLADGSRNLSIEHGLGGLENAFSELRKTKLAEHIPFTAEDKLVICAFIAAMHMRTRAQRNHWQSQLGDILQYADALHDAIMQMEPARRQEIGNLWFPSSRGQALSHQELKTLAESPLQQILIPCIPQETTMLMPLTLSILTTNAEPGFITSDAPCVWFDSEAYKRSFPHNGPGLAFDTIEITLPVSPQQMALLSRRPLRSYIRLTDDELVDELNRRTRFYCDEYFIVRCNVTKPIWFDLGQSPEPDDGAVCTT
jgi:hypothetical protein